MGSIATQDARGLFTKMLVSVYKEMTRPTTFLRSFFRNVESDTKELSIEIQRGTEKFAVDVLRGTEGNRNDFSRSSEKIFIPPYYREWFDATDLDFYDRLFGSAGGQVNEQTFQTWLEKVAEKLRLLQDKIERSYERQCAQVFSTGIVTLVNGDNIDFKRKAASKVDVGAARYFSAGTSDPINELKLGAKFLRTVGKATGGIVNAVFGDLAFDSFLSNTKVVNRADIRNFKLDDLNSPQRNAAGGVLHGRVAAGSWEVNLWTYPEFHDVSGTSTPYVDDKEMFLLPSIPNFVLGFASVPKIFRDTANAEFAEFIQQVRAAFVIGNYIDPRADKHVFDIKSAGIAIPVAVDQIYTAQVLV